MTALVLVVLAQSLNLNVEPLICLDEGAYCRADRRRAFELNCTGAGVTCSQVGGRINLDVTGGAGGGPGGGGAPVDGGYLTWSTGSTGSTNERTLSAGNYTTIDNATPGQTQVDWQHGLTCSSGQALTTSGTTALACTSTLTASDVACSGTCVSDAEIAGVSGAKVSGAVATATALAADPTDCSAGQYATTIAANGNLTCAQPAFSQLSGTASIAQGGTGNATSPEDATLVGNGTTWQAKTLPSCSNATTSKLLYNNSTNEFSCGTDQTGGGGGTTTVYSDGINASVNVASTSNVDLFSKTLTIAAGDTLIAEAWVVINNQSGTARTYTWNCNLGGAAVLAVTDGASITSSATNNVLLHLRCVYSVASTSSTRVSSISSRSAAVGAGSAVSGAYSQRFAWQTSGSNYTGSQAVGIGLQSNNGTATQTAFVESWRLTHHASNP